MSKKIKNAPLPNNITLKDYHILSLLSRGGYSFVYEAVSLVTKEMVVVKEFIPQIKTYRNESMVKEGKYMLKGDNDADSAYLKRGLYAFNNEIGIISRMRHHNIIHIIDYFSMNNTCYMVMPYEQGMTLFDYLYRMYRGRQFIEEQHVVKIFLGILEAINEIHKNKLLHLDLKPQNLWLRPNKEILVLDFGTALESGKKMDKMVRTDGYAAVEQYQKPHEADIGYWTDYYGIGATMYNLITGFPPMKSTEAAEPDLFADSLCQYDYRILESINLLCSIDAEKRKAIDLKKMIDLIKTVIPFQNNRLGVEEMFGIKPKYVNDLF